MQGKVEGTKVRFVKDYKDGSHTNIQYEGEIDNDTVEGRAHSVDIQML